MTKIQRPSKMQIRAIYDAGPEAVIALVESLYTVIEAQEKRIGELEVRVAELESKLKKNSGNSSQPPSSDGLKKGPKRSLRGKSGKASGGQKGHAGRTLKLVMNPDEVVIHPVLKCSQCAQDLRAEVVNGVEKRQVFDLPVVKLKVTEHQSEVKRCPQCGLKNRGQFPAEVAQPVQYGPRFRAQLVYFHSGQFIPLGRTVEIVEGLYGQPVSEATIISAVNEAAQAVVPVYEALKTYLAQTPEAVYCDETGARVEGRLHWVHSAGTPHATVYQVHPKRGVVGMDALGVLKLRHGWTVHDGWKPYFKYDLQHALCNAHHLRELTFIDEQFHFAWAKRMRRTLGQIKRAVDTARAHGRTTLSDEQLLWFNRRYDEILDQAEQEMNPSPPVSASSDRPKPKKSPATRLLNRLRVHRQSVLAFMYDFAVGFDNNLAERDVRMLKIQQKVSGCFRSISGAHAFCLIRSYLSTAHKNRLSALAALNAVFAGIPFSPPCLFTP